VKYELIIVRYGEIGLKAKATRQVFENKLINHVKLAFKKENIPHQIKRFRGRIFIYTGQIDKSIKILQKIFGITSVSPALKTSSDIDSMIKLAVDISNKNLTNKNSFALRVTRTGNQNYTSQDIAIKLGSEIVNELGASVNLRNPDFELNIEIRDESSYFFIEKIRGTGGLPYGSQGKILALIRSKKDILASWYILRRGCKIVFAIKNISLKNIINKFTKHWHLNEPKIIIYSNDDIKIITNKQKCQAVLTGGTIDDFSEIKKLKEKIQLPILTPLISMDEKEINEKTKEKGLSL